MKRDIRHLVRGGLLLVVGLAAFFGLRQLLIPQSFGQHTSDGTAAASVNVWMNRPVEYSLSSRCQTCHSAVYGKWEQSKHGNVACENCHGPALRHANTGEDLTIDKTRSLCLVCHQKLASRPKDFPQIDAENHGGQQTCVTCHSPHKPTIAQPPSIPHEIEGRSQCSLCHGQNGLKPVPASHDGRTNSVCLSCHQGKPFPAPVRNTTPAPPAQATEPAPAQFPAPQQAPAPPSPTPSPTIAVPPTVPHTLEGRTQCLICHGPQGLKPVPGDHTGRTQEMCLVCHKAGGK